MADDTTAMLGQYASSAELALQRLVTSQIMAMGPAGASGRKSVAAVNASTLGMGCRRNIIMHVR
jgi:hypothetical protein